MSDWMRERRPWETFSEYHRRVQRDAMREQYEMMRNPVHYPYYHPNMNSQSINEYDNTPLDVIRRDQEEQEKRNRKLILLL